MVGKWVFCFLDFFYFFNTTFGRKMVGRKTKHSGRKTVGTLWSLIYRNIVLVNLSDNFGRKTVGTLRLENCRNSMVGKM